MSMHADIKDTYSAQHTYYTQVTQSDVCSAILYVCLTPTRGMHTIPSNCMSKLSSSSYSMCVGGVVHAYNSLCMSLRGFFLYVIYIFLSFFVFPPSLFCSSVKMILRLFLRSPAAASLSPTGFWTVFVDENCGQARIRFQTMIRNILLYIHSLECMNDLCAFCIVFFLNDEKMKIRNLILLLQKYLVRL